MSVLHLVGPTGLSDPARPSGGNVYDVRLAAALQALGQEVSVVETIVGRLGVRARRDPCGLAGGRGRARRLGRSGCPARGPGPAAGRGAGAPAGRGAGAVLGPPPVDRARCPVRRCRCGVHQPMDAGLAGGDVRPPARAPPRRPARYGQGHPRRGLVHRPPAALGRRRHPGQGTRRARVRPGFAAGPAVGVDPGGCLCRPRARFCLVVVSPRRRARRPGHPGGRA